jgi:glutaconate CoA-transferase subunit A
MNDRVISLSEAVDLIPESDCHLAFGGVTLYRRPMAFSLALFAKYQAEGNPKHLTLLSFTAGFESDLLIGAGMVEGIRSCYTGLEAFGLAPHFTRSAGEGSLNIIEETEASLAYGLKAAISDVGFMPSRAWTGTDLFELRPDIKKVTDPYSGEELTAFPPVRCDVAVIHALEADHYGNAIIGGNWGVDKELALVADKVIITAEKLVPSLPKADIVGLVVSAIVETPGGAWPTSCHPLYPLDGEAALEYTETVGKPEYPDLLKRWGTKHKISIRS